MKYNFYCLTFFRRDKKSRSRSPEKKKSKSPSPNVHKLAFREGELRVKDEPLNKVTSCLHLGQSNIKGLLLKHELVEKKTYPLELKQTLLKNMSTVYLEQVKLFIFNTI